MEDLGWMYIFCLFDICNKCKKYVCKKEKETFLLNNSLGLICSKCNRLLFTVKFRNKDEELKRKKHDWRYMHNMYNIIFKKSVFLKLNVFYYDGKDFFFVHDRNDMYILVNFGRFTKEWVIVNNKMLFYYTFVKTSYQETRFDCLPDSLCLWSEMKKVKFINE